MKTAAYSREMTDLAMLNSAPTAEFVTALGGIYEHSDWVPRRISDQRPFLDLEGLRLAMRHAVDDASSEQKIALIMAHPDLAGKLAQAGALTADSTREQAGLGLDRLTEAEYEMFSDQNRRYREKFGFPLIICARLTTKNGVLKAFEKRLGNSWNEEISTALREIHEIARFRLIELRVS